MRGLPKRPLPSLEDAMSINVETAQIVQKNVRFVGISVNTKNLSRTQSRSYLDSLEDSHQLPCVDPFVTGVGKIVDNLL